MDLYYAIQVYSVNRFFIMGNPDIDKPHRIGKSAQQICNEQSARRRQIARQHWSYRVLDVVKRKIK